MRFIPFASFGFAIAFSSALPVGAFAEAAPTVAVYSVFEQTLTSDGQPDNPYVDIEATAIVTLPGGKIWRIPLFWDGEATWCFRVSPDRFGEWRWRVESADKGLDGQSGRFPVVDEHLEGSIRPALEDPLHFERQDGSPFWFMGDTAWAYYTDSESNKHNAAGTRRYIDTRVEQGFNVFHSMLLSEAGWGNSGGPPFDDIGSERINPGYWSEVDVRLKYLNERGAIAGLAIAWADKRGGEPYAWGRFPSGEARLRYARYIGARYSAYNVYFIVAGEWHSEVKRRKKATEEDIRREFAAIGQAVRDADPHDRMVAIHPMTRGGSVREWVGSSCMSFGDYQQNYVDLHNRVLESRRAGLPVVNSEYGYYLRDMNGDGLAEKSNSASLDAMRHATWDIAMAGGYFITGFGTTYFGGNRDPGPFDLNAAKNDVWEEQIQHVRALFTALDWTRLEPADDRVTMDEPRGKDRSEIHTLGSKRVRTIAPPMLTYWLLADPGATYLAYVRGSTAPLTIHLGDDGSGFYSARLFNPRNGEYIEQGKHRIDEAFTIQAPDERDWVLKLRRLD
jgi:hypothetical protein